MPKHVFGRDHENTINSDVRKSDLRKMQLQYSPHTGQRRALNAYTIYTLSTKNNIQNI